MITNRSTLQKINYQPNFALSNSSTFVHDKSTPSKFIETRGHTIKSLHAPIISFPFNLDQVTPYLRKLQAIFLDKDLGEKKRYSKELGKQFADLGPQGLLDLQESLSQVPRKQGADELGKIIQRINPEKYLKKDSLPDEDILSNVIYSTWADFDAIQVLHDYYNQAPYYLGDNPVALGSLCLDILTSENESERERLLPAFKHRLRKIEGRTFIGKAKQIASEIKEREKIGGVPLTERRTAYLLYASRLIYSCGLLGTIDPGPQEDDMRREIAIGMELEEPPSAHEMMGLMLFFMLLDSIATRPNGHTLDESIDATLESFEEDFIDKIPDPLDEAPPSELKRAFSDFVDNALYKIAA